MQVLTPKEYREKVLLKLRMPRGYREFDEEIELLRQQNYPIWQAVEWLYQAQPTTND